MVDIDIFRSTCIQETSSFRATLYLDPGMVAPDHIFRSPCLVLKGKAAALALAVNGRELRKYAADELSRGVRISLTF